MKKVLKRLYNAGLMPVAIIDDVDKAVPTAEALRRGGLDVMEITLRTKQGIDAIKAVKKAFPDMLVGAGTVFNVDRAKEALHAGAEFVVTPGFNPNLVSWCVANFIPIVPGCVTPSEVEQAFDYGVDILKFFPAEMYGGIKGCQALHGPYPMISFIPTGGVNQENLYQYVEKSYIYAVGGSWLCPAQSIMDEDFDGITKMVKASIEVLLGFNPETAIDEVTTNNIDRAVHYMKKQGYVIKLIFDNFGSATLMREGSERQLKITMKN